MKPSTQRAPEQIPGQARRIPQGLVLGSVMVEAAKAFPTRIFQGLETPLRIAYADYNTHQEKNFLNIKYLPNGAKTAPHPQIVFYLNGPYHVETLGYTNTDPLNWSTWMEFHLDAQLIRALIEAVTKAQKILEATQ